MNLNDWRNLFFAIGFIICLSIISPLSGIIPDQNREFFMTLALRGEEGLAEQYNKENGLNVTHNFPLRWLINIENHMNETQYVKILVKVLDSETPFENVTNCEPAASKPIFESSHIITSEETLVVPFNWSVVDVHRYGGKINITKMKINDHIINVDIWSYETEVLRIKFELRIYNETSKEFEYSLYDDDKEMCIWNQVWFTI